MWVMGGLILKSGGLRLRDTGRNGVVVAVGEIWVISLTGFLQLRLYVFEYELVYSRGLKFYIALACSTPW